MEPYCRVCKQYYRNCKCADFDRVQEKTTIRLEYKCRRCGGINDSHGTNKNNSIEILVSAIQQSSCRLNNNVPVPLLDLHTCEDGGKGIADLTGHSAPRD